MTQYIPPDSVTLTVDDGRFTVDSDDILSISTTKKAGKPMDEGEIALDNDYPYPYTLDTEIDVGDKIQFDRNMDGTTDFGEGDFGEGPWGGYETVGTYMVLDWDIIEHGPRQLDLVLTVADYVFSILNHRRVFYQQSGSPISGSSDAILNEILALNAPEIDRRYLPDIPVEIDYYTNGKWLRDVVDELAQYAAYYGAPVAQYSFADFLAWRRLDNIEADYAEPLGPSYGLWSSASESDSMRNQVRITGGLDTDNIDDEQTNASGTFEVSQDNPLITQLSTRKSEITRFELYTKGPNNPDGDGPRVRIHPGNAAGDAPIAPNDPDSDYINSGSRNTALEPDGFTMFNLGEHTLAERNPWLIVDTRSSDGYAIGTDGATDPTPAYRAYFPKRIAAQVPNRESIEQYMLKEEHIKNESLVTQEAVKGRADSYLERHASIPVVVGPLECQTDAAHGVQVGQVVPLDRPELRASGDFLATKKKSTYEMNQLTETVSFTGLDGYG